MFAEIYGHGKLFFLGECEDLNLKGGDALCLNYFRA